MILKLTTKQRFTLTMIVSAIKGNVAVMRKAIRLLDALELTDGEKEKVGFRVEPNGLATWDNPEHIWEIEIKDPDSLALLKEHIRAHSWQAQEARLMLIVFDQLSIE